MNGVMMISVDQHMSCPPLTINPISPVDSSSGGSSQSEETIAILPRRTRVIVVGNARTKRELIGQEGVVKRAVGLGGWHFLVLSKTGQEVKLQRNALQVLEYGPDDQQDSSSDEMTEAREPQIEILTRPRIRRPPKALSPVPDIFKPPPGIKSGIHHQSWVDLTKLEVVSLKRYRRVFQLPEVDAAAPKEELVGAVSRHFSSQAVDEGQVLFDFKAAVRRRYKQQLLMVQRYPTHYGYLADQQHQQHSTPSRQLNRY